MIQSCLPVSTLLHPQTVSGDGKSSSSSSSHREKEGRWLSLCPPLSTVTVDTKALFLYSLSKEDCVCLYVCERAIERERERDTRCIIFFKMFYLHFCQKQILNQCNFFILMRGSKGRGVRGSRVGLVVEQEARTLASVPMI